DLLLDGSAADEQRPRHRHAVRLPRQLEQLPAAASGADRPGADAADGRPDRLEPGLHHHSEPADAHDRRVARVDRADRRRVRLAAALLEIRTHGRRTARMTSRSLSFTGPAEDWLEALPIGNGRLGGMCWGGAPARIDLNEESVW